MFVPGGWLHIVMNLDFAIAITQNFCSFTNLEYVWLKTRFARPKLAFKLRKLLRTPPQELIERSKRKRKRFAKASKLLDQLDHVPKLDTSSSSSGSSSTSNGESSSDSDAHVICSCHGRKRMHHEVEE
jgi:histone arginine demethylase JMJD6